MFLRSGISLGGGSGPEASNLVILALCGGERKWYRWVTNGQWTVIGEQRRAGQTLTWGWGVLVASCPGIELIKS